VIVYCVNHCRNNVANWPTKRVEASGNRKDFAYYAAKDLAMAEDAKCGVMLWDGKSKGTLNNVQQLLSRGKKVLVYLAPENAFHKIGTMLDLQEFLSRCDSDSVQRSTAANTGQAARPRPVAIPPASRLNLYETWPPTFRPGHTA
jgi:hypothetical protein